MKQVYSKLTVAALAIGIAVGAQAQSLRNSDGPAEVPPPNFKGKQYVDSEGCVFVRAGYGGTTTWVPRVARNRKVVCGFRPTLAQAAPEPKPAASATPPRRTASAQPAAKPKPAPPARTRAAAPKPKPKAQPVRRVAAAPPPKQPPRSTAPAQAAARTACPNASPFSQRFLTSSSRFPVRCGPQGASPTVTAPAGTTAQATVVRPAPKIAPPAGYRAAFDDGRLNPNRGRGTAEGQAQMSLVWTDEVPRRLVDTRTGRVVRVAAAAPAQVAGHRYVQVGVYGRSANAQVSARRLQSLGLPVRIGNYRKGGKSYRVVMAGPFGSAGALQSGLSQARRAGFHDAFTRK